MKISGFTLVALGILALLYTGLSYSRQSTMLDVDPFPPTAAEQNRIPLSPIVGGIALISGIALLAGTRRSLARPHAILRREGRPQPQGDAAQVAS